MFKNNNLTISFYWPKIFNERKPYWEGIWEENTIFIVAELNILNQVMSSIMSHRVL